MRRRMLMQMGSAIPSADFVILIGDVTEYTFRVRSASAFEYKYTDTDGVKQVVNDKSTSEHKVTIATQPNSYVEINGEITKILLYTGTTTTKDVELYINNPTQSLTTIVAMQCSLLRKIKGYENTSIQSIQNNAFLSCIALESITLPQTLTNIGVSAFKGDINLVVNSLPDSITSIGQGAFQDTKINIPKLPDSLHTIGQTAFSGCKDLNVTELPSGVTSIGLGAFHNTKITDIKILNNTQMVTSGTNMFNAGTIIRVPNALLSQYQADTNWSTYNLIGY